MLLLPDFGSELGSLPPRHQRKLTRSERASAPVCQQTQSAQLAVSTQSARSVRFSFLRHVNIFPLIPLSDFLVRDCFCRLFGPAPLGSALALMPHRGCSAMLPHSPAECGQFLSSLPFLPTLPCPATIYFLSCVSISISISLCICVSVCGLAPHAPGGFFRHCSLMGIDICIL